MIDITRFHGTGVALVTPFNKDLSVDYQGLEKLLQHTYEHGADYYVVLGTTGESATTTRKEKKEILEFVLNNNPGRLPVVYGLGGNNTRQLIEDMEYYDLSQVDAILSVSPYYNKPAQAGLKQHYELLANNSAAPLILYNVPGRTASNMIADTTLELAKHPNIIAVKEASGNMVQCMRIAQQKPKDFLLLAGDDLLTLPIISVGGQGVISVLANAFPHLFKAMSDHGQAGRLAEAQQALHQLLAINPLMYKESNPVGVKYVLEQLGICQPYVRLPLLPASEGLRREIRQCMEKIDLPAKV